MGSYQSAAKPLVARSQERGARKKAKSKEASGKLNPEQQVDVDLAKAKRPNVFTFGRCSLNLSLAEDAQASTANCRLRLVVS